MAKRKKPEEIELMAQGGVILSNALKAAVDAVHPGVDIRKLDQIAEDFLRSHGATPSFKGYQSHLDEPPFPSTLCVSIDHEVVHGRADRAIQLKEGSVVSLDIGCWFEGLCTDMAVTVPVGVVSDDRLKLLEVTYKSLLAGIEAAQAGARVKQISRAVESFVRPHGYGIVRALVGHGVGHAVHESPQVPNFIDARPSEVVLESGMCIAIEPMITLGTWDVDTADDGWAVVTIDQKPAAHFEATIAITEAGPRILTPIPVIPHFV